MSEGQLHHRPRQKKEERRGTPPRFRKKVPLLTSRDLVLEKPRRPGKAIAPPPCLAAAPRGLAPGARAGHASNLDENREALSSGGVFYLAKVAKPHRLTRRRLLELALFLFRTPSPRHTGLGPPPSHRRHTPSTPPSHTPTTPPGHTPTTPPPHHRGATAVI